MRNRVSEAKREETNNEELEGDRGVRANIPGSAIVLCVCLQLPHVHEMDILDHPRHRRFELNKILRPHLR